MPNLVVRPWACLRLTTISDADLQIPALLRLAEYDLIFGDAYSP